MNLVNEELLLDIDGTKEVIEENDLSRLVYQAIEQEAISHSDALEKTRRSRVLKRRDLKATLSHLQEAWTWAVKNYDGTLTKEFLTKIAWRVEPRTGNQGFRTDTARIQGYTTLPPRPEKILHELDAILPFLNDHEEHSVERAVQAHFHIVRIHPFVDGNGRTARFVQNLILNEAEYAPIIITPTERTFYHSLLEDAKKAYNERVGFQEPLPRNQETLFAEWLATKELQSLERTVHVLDDLPRYEIAIERANSPGYLYTAKRVLQAHFRPPKVGNVRLNVNRRTLTVTGEIDEQTLQNLLQKKTSALKYTIQAVR